MQYAYTDEAPVAEVVKGLVVISMAGGGGHPPVCAPIHVVREFCELTIRKLDAYDANQHGRVVPLRKRKRRKGPPTHGG